ncbi:hypothetical protein [Spirosoma radiotolerans]|uniref:Uncharacterized protein n=1 Tax=Spirosoma radiotolerans TaxID=1379870 RepID=A0A0E3V716_9BACT|nr:hypothetical protein [Spirosoma radiotolerans]AKD55041.1 hypothetical protein SD10_09120 [Spirosoma radiotolerans]
MLEALNKLKAVPGEAFLVLALFAGATIHAIRQKQIPVAEGLTGAIVSFTSGFFGFKILGALFPAFFVLDDVWMFGFPIAYGANYWLGGMDTVGEQIRDKPVQTIVSWLGIIADEALSKYDKIATYFKSKPNA